ncbi:MAG: MBL fold metallo-hydrolase [Armatimonadetes bacterium]|nr:MBL fold metallo-hydrolase [Armatimonadota bacterium]
MRLPASGGGSGLRVRSLASGSNGNCTLVATEEAAILIDAGISARAILAGLAATGVAEGAVRAILLTHEHSDHTRGLAAVARRLGAVVIANEATLRCVGGEAPPFATRVLGTGDELTAFGIRVRSFPLSHDAADPVGYLLEAGGRRVGCATDTGVAGDLAQHLRGLDLAIVEANHDEERLLAGPYPWALKRRILGERGHLSNATAAALVAELLETSPATEVWLAHLSATNNSPALALNTVCRHLGAAADRVSLAPRGQPGPVWNGAARFRQLTLF